MSTRFLKEGRLFPYENPAGTLDSMRHIADLWRSSYDYPIRTILRDRQFSPRFAGVQGIHLTGCMFVKKSTRVLRRVGAEAPLEDPVRFRFVDRRCKTVNVGDYVAISLTGPI
jgi:hypothetical protein